MAGGRQRWGASGRQAGGLGGQVQIEADLTNIHLGMKTIVHITAPSRSQKRILLQNIGQNDAIGRSETLKNIVIVF